MAVKKRIKSYVLIWRVPTGAGLGGLHGVDWDQATGGLVMMPRRVITCEDGRVMPVVDWRLARELAHQRYRPGPWEELILAEVFEPKEQRQAAMLHLKWELEMRQFLSLMEV